MKKLPLTYYNGVPGSLKPGDYIDPGFIQVFPFARLSSASVAGLQTSTLYIHTVTEENFTILGVECSGDNRATYKIFLDGVLAGICRTSLLNFDGQILLPSLKIEVGTLVEIKVTNDLNTPSNFDVSLIGFTF